VLPAEDCVRKLIGHKSNQWLALSAISHLWRSASSCRVIKFATIAEALLIERIPQLSDRLAKAQPFFQSLDHK